MDNVLNIGVAHLGARGGRLHIMVQERPEPGSTPKPSHSLCGRRPSMLCDDDWGFPSMESVLREGSGVQCKTCIRMAHALTQEAKS